MNPALVLPAPAFAEKEKTFLASRNTVRKAVQSFYLSVNEEVHRTPRSNQSKRAEDARISAWLPIEEHFPYSTRPQVTILSLIIEV